MGDHFLYIWNNRVMGIAHQGIDNQFILCSTMHRLIECILADKRG